jgi:hypothetical protein
MYMCVCVCIDVYMHPAVSRGETDFSLHSSPKDTPHILLPSAPFLRRNNKLGVAGWAAVAGGLEGLRCLTRLNGCDQYGAIRKGGLKEMRLKPEWELGVWATGFLGRSESTLTRLDVR